MLTRKIGKILRGKATPFQILSACILGGLIGFIPTFMGAPGLVITLVLILVILNANLGIAAITAGLAKLVSFALLPLSFNVGAYLSTGPTEGVLRAGVNTPVLAFFGFERPAVVGSLVLGLVFGLIVGIVLVKSITGFRKKMATLEEGSERYQKYISKKWVKILVWLVAGKGSKKSYADLLGKKVGNPIRILGVVFAVLVVGLIWIGSLFLTEPLVTMALKAGLEKANGATVDVKSASLNLSEGRLSAEGLAMADPNALDTDLLRAVRLEADVSATDLLTKRLALDNVQIIDASTGEKRKTRGVLVGDGPEPTPPPEPGADEKTLEDYIKDAKKWQERLAQVRRWIEEMSRQPEEPAPGEPGAPGAPKKETLRERLARQAKQMGYVNVVASHLIDDHPRLLVRNLQVDGLRGIEMPGRDEPEVLDVSGENLSTEPWLVQGAPRITVKSRSGLMDASVVLGSVSAAPSQSTIAFDYRDMPADVIGAQLKSLTGEPPISGGTITVSLNGALSAGGVPRVDLPLNITLKNTTLSLQQVGSTQVDNFTLPIGLRGPIDNPAVSITDKALQDALVKAGKDEVAKRLAGEADKAIDKATEKIGDEAGKKAKGILGDLLGSGEKDD